MQSNFSVGPFVGALAAAAFYQYVVWEQHNESFRILLYQVASNPADKRDKTKNHLEIREKKKSLIMSHFSFRFSLFVCLCVLEDVDDCFFSCYFLFIINLYKSNKTLIFRSWLFFYFFNVFFSLFFLVKVIRWVTANNKFNMGWVKWFLQITGT